MVKTIELKEIEINKIKPNYLQPREKFDEDKVKSLAESILSNGLINAITVRKEKKSFVIVAGERRWRAHKLAKLKRIRAEVKEYSNKLEWMRESFLENRERENLSDWEEWKYIKAMAKEGSWVHKNNEGHYKKGEINLRVVSDNLKVSKERAYDLYRAFEKTTVKTKEAIRKGKIATSTAGRFISKLSKEEQDELSSQALVGKREITQDDAEDIVKEKKKKELLTKIVEEVKKEKTFDVIKLDKVLKQAERLILGVNKAQEKAINFLANINDKGILQELEWKDTNNIISAGRDDAKEYLQFLNKIYRRL